jgi:ribosomal-protein-alanine N-acetyltransferase
MLNLNFDPFPILKTERLTLRQISPNDANEVFVIRSNKQTMHFIPRPVAQNMQDVTELLEKWNKSFFDGEGINWAITLTGEDKLLGMVGFVRMTKEHFRAELGYVLNPDYHGKGIMSEAVEAVMRYGFETIGYYSVEAVIDPENKSSVSVAERAGFKKEAHFKERDFYHGKFNDTTVYTRHAKDARSH